MEDTKCQIYCIKGMSGKVAGDEPSSRVTRAKVMLTRWLGPARKRALKRRLNQLYRSATTIAKRDKSQEVPAATEAPSPALQAGDMVRVKSYEEIQATLGLFNDLKGLAFMPVMRKYCGTEQRVLKPLRRFFDEREYEIRRAKGIVLLDGLMCEGTEMFGPCDRACFFFWREEWLELVEQKQA